MKVYNKDKGLLEPAKLATCPRCRGFGGITQDQGEACSFCRGYGEVWRSATGWLRAKHQQFSKSFLY